MFTAMLHYDITKIIKYIDLGADINHECRDKSLRVLDFAIGNSNIDLLNVLIEKKVNMNYIKKDLFLPPLHHVCIFSNYTIMEILLKNGADANFHDQWGRTPLYYVITYVIHTQCFKKVKLLLSHGANIYNYNKDGKSYLTILAYLPVPNEDVYFFLLRTYFNIPEPGDISTPVLTGGI